MSLLEYNIMKARHGRYADTAENRRLHRVGQEYGHAAKEDPEAAKKSGKGEEAKEEKRTFDTARKELSAVLSHKDEFIQKYGEDEYNKRVGALVAEAKTLRDTEHTAEADKDFDKLKQPEKPKDTRSKKEKRTERLTKYKEQLKKVQEKMNQEGESEESRKMGEALEAKWKAKIEKLEAKVNRGSKKKAEAEPSKPEEPKSEAKKKPWANKGVGMPKSDGKKLFEGLTKEQQKDLTDKYKEESESMLRQENMTPELVIGAIEEFIGENLYESDDVIDLAEELKVSKNEAQAIIRHTLDLEMKRLEGLEKEVDKKPSDPMSELPERGESVEFKMDNVDVKVENVTEFSSDNKDMYRVDISKNGRHIADVTTHVPETIRKVIEKYGTDPAKTKGLVDSKGDGPRFESKKGLVIADIDEYDRADFERYSGTNTEDAVAFMNKVIDKTGFNGRAKLFYSGNAGWTLFDENENKIGNLMYKGNQYGLEDATWGDGWVWQGWGSDWSRKLSQVIQELNVRPEKPRM